MSWIQALETWFKNHKREMPWRSEPSAYRIWISEMMLQQTQVETVIPYFNRFLKRFPTVESLAEAPLEEVLKSWEGLGYYSRARNLHKAAKQVAHEFNGELPSTYEGLQKLSGIGPYCAAAIASIAFGVAVPVVDGNVLRVFSRFWALTTDISLPAARKTIFTKLQPAIEQSEPAVFNQAIMELGALICKPKNPKCELCPLSQKCRALLENKISLLPVKSKSEAIPHYNIAVAVIYKDEKVLIAKRKETQMLGGLWEFPGGKQENDETMEETLHREVKEELGIKVKIHMPLCTVKHAFTHFKITLHVFVCDYISGQPKALSADQIRWAHPDSLDQYPFPTANRKIIQAILAQTKTLFSK